MKKIICVLFFFVAVSGWAQNYGANSWIEGGVWTNNTSMDETDFRTTFVFKLTSETEGTGELCFYVRGEDGKFAMRMNAKLEFSLKPKQLGVYFDSYTYYDEAGDIESVDPNPKTIVDNIAKYKNKNGQLVLQIGSVAYVLTPRSQAGI